MPEIQSNASRYQSRYGGGFITPNNYIVELICERIALKEKLGALPVKFWSLPKWKKIYMQQLLIATSLLKMYDPQAVITGLKKHPKVWSLRAPWLDDTFKEEQESLNKQKELIKQREVEKEPTREALPAQTEPEAPRESFSPQKSIKAKLRDLD